MKKFNLFLISVMITCGLAAQDFDEEIQVRLVELDVKITNNAGTFINDLPKGAFRVTENGVPVTIEKFQEINVPNLSAAEKRALQPRVMLVLDLKNTSFSRMKRTFPQLLQYADTLFSQHSQIGLAINAEGYAEVLPFTHDQAAFRQAVLDSEKYYQRSKYRILRPENTMSTSSNYRLHDVTRGPDSLGGEKKTAQEFIQEARYEYDEEGPISGVGNTQFSGRITGTDENRYLYSELQALGQFVNFLGAYSGKKSVILVSQFWDIPLSEKVLRNTITTCVQQKITLNVLGYGQGPNEADTKDVYTADQSGFGLGTLASLAANTAGFSRTIEYRQLPTMIEKTIAVTEHYYRISYYSDLDNDKYRKIRVRVPQSSYSVATFSGFNPASRSITAETSAATLSKSTLENADLNLSMTTAWMDWEWSSIGRRKAYFAVGQRAYDSDGNIIGEKVEGGQLVRRKYDGVFEELLLEKEYVLNLPPDAKLARLEFVVVDLATGKTVAVDKI